MIAAVRVVTMLGLGVAIWALARDVASGGPTLDDPEPLIIFLYFAAAAAVLAARRYFRGGHERVRADAASGLIVVLVAIVMAEGAHRLLFSDAARAAVDATLEDSLDGRASVRLVMEEDGHFVAGARINGARLEMLVDTGSSRIALPFEVARGLGFDVDELSFDRRVMTANGMTPVALITLDEISIGAIIVEDVAATVAQPGRLARPLLGMNFLTSLSEIRISGREMRLID